jgi:hypothetical protein
MRNWSPLEPKIIPLPLAAGEDSFLEDFGLQVDRSGGGWVEGQRPYLTKKVAGAKRRYVRVSPTRETAVGARAPRESRGTWFTERFSDLSTRGGAALEHLIPGER